MNLPEFTDEMNSLGSNEMNSLGYKLLTRMALAEKGARENRDH